MHAFVSRKRKWATEPPKQVATSTNASSSNVNDQDDESTDFKLALLASLHPSVHKTTLLEALLCSDGSVEAASTHLAHTPSSSSKKRLTSFTVGYQSSLSAYGILPKDGNTISSKSLVKKGRTLYLYSPEDIENNTPCSIIHNFLPAKQADALLSELLEEAPSYQRQEFKLFGRVVWTPHTYCCLAEAEKQKTEYMYNGRQEENVRQSTQELLKACPQVESAVNREIQRRISNFYPKAQKLKYQSPHPWRANTAFVNCYDGPKENVGYHSDQLTYLGPRAVIGSLSLGVTREFRVRKIIAKDDTAKLNESLADAQGQISIQLPHNSLLIMHAEMQEEWKHSIAPAQAIDPHPLAKNKRINITYRYYKEILHPKFTPRCQCGMPTVLRCATRKKECRGRYMWMCHTHYVPGNDGCGFFQWAEFDDDGEPPWVTRLQSDRYNTDGKGELDVGGREAFHEL
ncbi:hypothetical protein IAQ61_006481 [Plenodomus lingam]|uniref:uncharacterized protein n=1 Tax=Leptosphaeria maculans TaxID=5022 RepID=UPI0033313EA2|nr:hypothetical protein IAQ61_006481 [Plenodomus lingam]